MAVRAASIQTLDSLPLFATDEEIARAVVGPDRAADWMQNHLPSLQAQAGFPPLERSHGGRYTPAVKAFYDRRYNIGGQNPGLDKPEDASRWRRRA